MLEDKASLSVIHLKNIPIFEQLQYEEFLLRDCSQNFCLINYGSPPAIVMGISGKLDELVHSEQAQSLNIPIIKRFSGGGTVVVDENTLFVTFIFNQQDVDVPGFPEPIYKFTESIYQNVFNTLPFELKQNDYVLSDRKIGGNAQYIKKDRWLHHTSFLWDFKPEYMALLKHPPKTPLYRQNRSHEEFIVTLKHYLPSIDHPVESLLVDLHKRFHIEQQAVELPVFKASRSSTQILL